MARHGDLLVCWPEELRLRTNGGPQSGLGPYVRTVKTKSGVTAVQVVYVRGGGSRSAAASLRTTCSGVCFFLVAMLMSSPPARMRAARLSNDLDQGRPPAKAPPSVQDGYISTRRTRKAVSASARPSPVSSRARLLASSSQSAPTMRCLRCGRTRHPWAARCPASATTSRCDGTSTRTCQAGKPALRDLSRSCS